MKRVLGLILTILCFTFMCTPFHCNHVHTPECGKNGENCMHKCIIIEPKRDETTKI